MNSLAMTHKSNFRRHNSATSHALCHCEGNQFIFRLLYGKGTLKNKLKNHVTEKLAFKLLPINSHSLRSERLVAKCVGGEAWA